TQTDSSDEGDKTMVRSKKKWHDKVAEDVEEDFPRTPGGETM
ncbi:2317_t:CDS:2, partial [Acaulospora morrowiae]